MPRKMANIVVVDERPGMGLASALQKLAGVRVCAEVGTAAEAVEALETLAPHALILDISLPRLGGLGLIRALKRLHPDVPVIAISPEGSRQRAAAALKAGARAFLVRDGAPKSFLAALERIRSGSPYIDRRLRPERTVIRSRRNQPTAA